MRAGLAWGALLAGCAFHRGAAPSDSSGSGSAVPDVQVPDTPDPVGLCFGTDLGLCLTTAPAGDVTLPPMIDTNNMGMCTEVVAQVNGPSVCVIAGDTILVNTTVATGDRPLALIANGGITVSGTLDVSSTGNQHGAGHTSALCAAAGKGTDDNHGAGGGAGGSFGTGGGDGGKGDDTNIGNNHLGGIGGTAGATGTPPPLRGGCDGADGGDGDGGHHGGTGGTSGGAVALLSRTSIMIGGTVDAGGAGGTGGHGQNNLGDDPVGGGGGGGGGGMIALDAPMISLGGFLAANGGAGGGGGGDNGDGGAGGDAGTASTVAGGGSGGGAGLQQGGAGGDGAAGMTGAKMGGSVISGGGGGGGGAGVIWIHGTLSGSSISPPATTH